MAVASDSTPTPARPLLPFADPRTAVETLDDIRRDVERQEARVVMGVPIAVESTAPSWPAPAPLPSLRTALSRRAALFGAVAATGFLGAAAVDALPARASALSINDARLIELADAYAALDAEVDATPSTATGYSDLIERYEPLEDEMATTPADTIVGVGAKARVCQLSSLRDCMSGLPMSVADDVWRLHAAGALV